MAWQDSFLDPERHTRTIGKKEHTFYPVSVGTAFKLRTIISPLSQAMATLFAGHSLHTTTRISTEEGDQATVSPPSPEAIEASNKAKSAAISQAIESLMAPKNVEAIGEIIMDSLREDFPKGATANPPATEFIMALPVTLLPEFLIGVATANKGILGPLQSALGPAMARAEGVFKARVQEVAGTVRPAEAKTEEPKPTPVQAGP